jgi:hypothetical protein
MFIGMLFNPCVKLQDTPTRCTGNDCGEPCFDICISKIKFRDTGTIGSIFKGDIVQKFVLDIFDEEVIKGIDLEVNAGRPLPS